MFLLISNHDNENLMKIWSETKKNIMFMSKKSTIESLAMYKVFYQMINQ